MQRRPEQKVLQKNQIFYSSAPTAPTLQQSYRKKFISVRILNLLTGANFCKCLTSVLVFDFLGETMLCVQARRQRLASSGTTHELARFACLRAGEEVLD